MPSSIQQIAPLQAPWQTSDPFLFCAFHNDQYPKGNGKLGPNASLSGRMIGQDFGGKDGWSMYHGTEVPGFPAHPHLGFETVTIVEEGLVDHADSLKSAGRFGNGDVQWMTAGKGVQHSEMFPLLNEDRENPFLLFQIWLNLPAKSKKVDPYYLMLWNEDIPVFTEKSIKGNTTFKIIAGNIGEESPLAPPPDSWASEEKNEVAIWIIRAEPGSVFHIPAASQGTNRKLFYYNGNTINIEGQTVESNQSIQLDSTSQVAVENGDAESHFLYLQGKPLNEPVAHHGPFVMNYPAELKSAFEEYQRTEFGGWPWPKHDLVHDSKKGRFAIYPDGKEEIRD